MALKFHSIFSLDIHDIHNVRFTGICHVEKFI